jgi:hypothetical protein
VQESLAPTLEQKKSRRGLLTLIGAGGAAAVAALLGRSNGAEAAALSGDSSSPAVPAVSGVHSTAGTGVSGTSTNGYGVAGFSSNDTGVKGESAAATGVKGTGNPGVHGFGGNDTGVKGEGQPGVFGISGKDNASGVRGDGTKPGSIGVLARNTSTRRALRTKGRVQMDTARKKTLSNKSNLITLPTGVNAGTNAIVMAVVQGAPGNEALVRRAYRVDEKHIRIDFDKKPANPTAVGYWIVHTG